MIVISIEGVLAESAPTWALSSASLTSGRTLYNALLPNQRVLLLGSDPYPERVKAWLLKERFRHYAELHCWPVDSPVTIIEWKLQKLKELASTGSFTFFIDSDPEIVALAVREGITSLLPIYPATFPGRSLRPVYTAWGELVDTIEEQNLIRATREVASEGS